MSLESLFEEYRYNSAQGMKWAIAGHSTVSVDFYNPVLLFFA